MRTPLLLDGEYALVLSGLSVNDANGRQNTMVAGHPDRPP
jgi:hypothetical protein